MIIVIHGHLCAKSHCGEVVSSVYIFFCLYFGCHCLLWIPDPNPARTPNKVVWLLTANYNQFRQAFYDI